MGDAKVCWVLKWRADGRYSNGLTGEHHWGTKSHVKRYGSKNEAIAARWIIGGDPWSKLVAIVRLTTRHAKPAMPSELWVYRVDGCVGFQGYASPCMSGSHRYILAPQPTTSGDTRGDADEVLSR